MRYGVRQKFCVCTRLTHNGIRNCVTFLLLLSLYLCIQRTVYVPLFLPCIIHGTSSVETIVGCLFEGRKSAVIIRILVVESNIFSDLCCELLCFVLRDFADPRHGWDHTCLSTGKREWREKAQEVTQMRHAHPLTRAVRHGSLHDPIKRSVSVSVYPGPLPYPCPCT